MPAMTMTGAGVTLNFLAAQSDDSTFMLKLPIVVEEVLETEGVNGRRWRTKFEQMAPAQVETLTDCTNYAAAVAEAQYQRNMIGALVSVSWSAGGSTYTYKQVHVVSCTARPIAGAIVGGGAASGAAAHVRTTWMLEPTDFNVFAN